MDETGAPSYDELIASHIPDSFSGVVSVRLPAGAGAGGVGAEAGGAGAATPAAEPADARFTITHARGLAYRPESIAVKPGTRFGIASGTKGFTATAILQLVADGRLELEDRVADLLPGRLPELDRAITVRHLLTHTSGIGDYCDEEEECDFEAIWAERPVYAFTRPADFTPLFANLPAKFPPGERFCYNNAGFIVLAMIIEAVTGMPFADAVSESVFEAADMSGAGFFRSDSLPPGCAVGYLPSQGDTGGSEAGAATGEPAGDALRWRSNIYSIPVIGGGDGGAYATAGDMHRYWRWLLGPECGSPKIREMILGTRIAATQPDDGRRGYSLGHWLADDWAETRIYYLTGSDPGVSFLSGYLPAGGSSFAILANEEIALRPLLDGVLAVLCSPGG